MPNYRRAWIAGGTYFFTLVTHQRRQWLCHPVARRALREAIHATRCHWPFVIEAWVLLPDHLHCIWTLPEGDADNAVRWKRIKQMVSQRCNGMITTTLSDSRARRGESALWQRRFWEHLIRDETDFKQHCDYIHYNPVKHGYCLYPAQWPYSTLKRLIRHGRYPGNWGMSGVPQIADDVGHE